MNSQFAIRQIVMIDAAPTRHHSSEAHDLNQIEERNAGQVRFRYKDYADGHQLKVMTVAAVEFIRRFLLHVLPKQFVRIRHYGLLAILRSAKHCSSTSGNRAVGH